MSKQLIINSLEFAHGGKVTHGKIGPGDLVRLHDYLHSLEGIIDYTLSGSVTEHGDPMLVLLVNGELALACQRCLGPLKHLVEIETFLRLVNSESELPDIAEEDSTVDHLMADSALDVFELLEEEIILELPIAARHAIEECKKSDYVQSESSAGRVNLAASLSGLKKSNH